MCVAPRSFSKNPGRSQQSSHCLVDCDVIKSKRDFRTATEPIPENILERILFFILAFSFFSFITFFNFQREKEEEEEKK
jgi:hypothetical protein